MADYYVIHRKGRYLKGEHHSPKTGALVRKVWEPNPKWGIRVSTKEEAQKVIDRYFGEYDSRSGVSIKKISNPASAPVKKTKTHALIYKGEVYKTTDSRDKANRIARNHSLDKSQCRVLRISKAKKLNLI